MFINYFYQPSSQILFVIENLENANNTDGKVLFNELKKTELTSNLFISESIKDRLEIPCRLFKKEEKMNILKRGQLQHYQPASIMIDCDNHLNN